MGKRGFWDKLKKPIVGLAPMDGVTDFAFRHMLAKYGKPSIIFTEFVNVEGLARGAVKMLSAFIYEEKERPIVGQLFGVEVDSFYKSALMLCALGFDGIDINMGCPVNKIAKRGSGAGLIKTPEIAKKIILTVKKAAEDFANGAELKDVGVSDEMIKKIEEMNFGKGEFVRKIIPISVKTRIGYDKIVAEEWVKHLLEVKPANITMHGRTLKQMYKGNADWDVLAQASAVCKGSGTSFLGNGDAKSMKDALKKIKDYGVDGVLVGRATFGNPWFFSGVEPSINERLEAALEHVEYMEFARYARSCQELGNPPAAGRLFEKVGVEFAGNGNGALGIHFYPIKKHLAWYCKGFEGVKELRLALMQAKDFKTLKRLIKNYLD